jgi:hypothetical protein
MRQYNFPKQGRERQASNLRLQGFNLALQPTQLHSPTEVKRIELLTDITRRRFQNAFLVHTGQPPQNGENGGTRTPTLRFRKPTCYPVTPRSHLAESSGLEPQLFIHLFSKQRRSASATKLFARSGYSPQSCQLTHQSTHWSVGQESYRQCKKRRFYRPTHGCFGCSCLSKFGSADGS